MNKKKILPFLALILFLLNSCDEFNFLKNIFPTSERVKYEQSYPGSDSLLIKWKNGFDAALSSDLKIPDEYVGKFPINKINVNAVGYSLILKKGVLLHVDVSPVISDKKIFVDFFEENSGLKTAESKLLKNGRFTTFIERDGTYKLILQPEIDYVGKIDVKIYTQSSLLFPVAGKTNRDAQSFWGASRDGGQRSHEGVDIFASRGTPVVAATDGYVTRTGNEGLGGKQVWLRDIERGFSLYYAHLDSVITDTGRKVKRGDTLGTVGNTGNAKGGATHLHFGVYSTGGAVDAFPFIRERKVPLNEITDSRVYTHLKSGSNLRIGPGTDYMIKMSITEETPVTVLAEMKEWIHIRTKEGKEGFVSSSRLK